MQYVSEMKSEYNVAHATPRIIWFDKLLVVPLLYFSTFQTFSELYANAYHTSEGNSTPKQKLLKEVN